MIWKPVRATRGKVLSLPYLTPNLTFLLLIGQHIYFILLHLYSAYPPQEKYKSVVVQSQKIDLYLYVLI